MTKYFTKDGDNYVEVGDTLLPQTDVDSIVEKRLERERNKFADYADLKEKAGKVDTVKSEYEKKLAEEAKAKSDLEKQLGSAKLETEKERAIRKFKLSDEAAEFLAGETADEILERAEKLSKIAPGGGGVHIDKKPKPGEKPSPSKVIAGKLFGSKSDD